MVSFSGLTALTVVTSSLLLHPVAAMWPNSWIVGNTCQTTAKKNFDKCNNQDSVCLCKNKNYLASVAHCINDNLQIADDIDAAWGHVLSEGCKVSPVESDQVFKDSMEYLNKTQLTPVTKFSNYSTVYDTPISTDREIVRETYVSIYLNLHNRDVGTWQGSALVMIWVFVAGVTTLYRFFRYVSVTFGSRKQSMGRPNWLLRFYYKKISIPAVFGERHIDRYYLFNFIPIFFPTRFESMIIGFYFLMNIIFMCTGYTFMDNNPLWATHYSEMALNVSNRAGILACIQVPLLTLFALRNNLLIWLTGWSFSTFNAYHRAVSRVTFILAVIHAATKHKMMQTFHAPLRIIYFPTLLFRVGVTAISLWSLMVLLGFFRVKYYEAFLFVHVTGAIAAYICILYHLNGLGYKQTMYVSLGLLCADLVIRIGRIVFANVSIYIKPISESNKTTKAYISLLPSGVVNVRVRTPIQWPYAPGQYVYIHFNRLNIIESHPFSAVGPSSQGESFQLLCKARGGITKRLREYIEANIDKEGEQIKMDVLIEGPYGVHCPVERYDSILLVAGGIGITGIIPYVEYLVLSPHPHEIHLIWTVATVSELTWIDERLQWLSRTGKARIKLYVTRSNKVSASDTTVHHFGIPGHNLENVDLNEIGNDQDNIHLVGNETRLSTRPGDYSHRRKISIKKHIRNISHSSNVFQLEKEERMENIDGGQMVDWTDDNPDRTTGSRRKMGHLSHRSRSSQSNIPTSEKSQTAGNAYGDENQPRESLSNYNTNYNSNNKYSYGAGQRSSNDVPSNDYEMKNFNENTQVNVQEMSNQQIWMDHVIEGTRPNLNDTVKELFQESTGSVCIVGCGPSRMMDSLRQAAVVNYDLVKNGRIDYYEEAFTW